MPLAIALLFGGLLLVYMGITNESLSGILSDTHIPLNPAGDSTPQGFSPTQGTTGPVVNPVASPSSGAISSVEKQFPGFSSIVGINPIPGATGGRLDQGFDITSSHFLSPYAGRVVYSSQHDSGWKGGGYVAIANLIDPQQVTYFAEGIIPIVKEGQTVKAGQAIGIAAPNPYTPGPSGVGSIEIGPANPANPKQPLAQVVSNPTQVVDRFYNWLVSLGGPKTDNPSGAGHA